MSFNKLNNPIVNHATMIAMVAALGGGNIPQGLIKGTSVSKGFTTSSTNPPAEKRNKKCKKKTKPKNKRGIKRKI